MIFNVWYRLIKSTHILIPLLVPLLNSLVTKFSVNDMRLIVGIRPFVHMWDLGLWGSTLRGVFLYPLFKRISEETTWNSERLGRHARPRIEPGTSRLPVWTQNLSASGEMNDVKAHMVFTSLKLKTHPSNFCEGIRQNI